MSNTRAISHEKRHGQHYTPTELAQFLVARSIEHLSTIQDELVVVDPACGDGELLLATAEAVQNEGWSGQLTLIGYEVNEDAAALARTRLASKGVDAQILLGNFLTEQRTLSSRSVDLIITNPPYVRTQHLGQDAAQLLAAEFNLSGRVDLTHPFVTVASRLLRRGGVLGLLCSNRVFTTLAGENVRRTLLHDELRVRKLFDLGDTKLFKAAVLPAIIIASRDEPTKQVVPFVSVYEQADCAVHGGWAQGQPVICP